MFFPIINPNIKRIIEIKLSKENEYPGYNIKMLPKLKPIIPNIVCEWYLLRNFCINFIKIIDPIPAPIIIGKSTVIFATEIALK